LGWKCSGAGAPRIAGAQPALRNKTILALIASWVARRRICGTVTNAGRQVMPWVW